MTSGWRTDPEDEAMQPATDAPRISGAQVWDAVERASFAIISHVTPAGEPRSSGVVYAVKDHHLYLAVAPDSWKARHIEDGQEVAVTVPVRRGGVLSMVVPIPPATVSFHARAIVHPPGTLDVHAVSKKLESLVPEDRRSAATILEFVPECGFHANPDTGSTAIRTAVPRVFGHPRLRS